MLPTGFQKTETCVAKHFEWLSQDTSCLQVKANDPHYDAKCFPCVHPWGTGSLLAEPGSGASARYTRNRATSIESFFRRIGIALLRPTCRTRLARCFCDASRQQKKDCDLVLLEARLPYKEPPLLFEQALGSIWTQTSAANQGTRYGSIRHGRSFVYA